MDFSVKQITGQLVLGFDGKVYKTLQSLGSLTDLEVTEGTE